MPQVWWVRGVVFSLCVCMQQTLTKFSKFSLFLKDLFEFGPSSRKYNFFINRKV